MSSFDPPEVFQSSKTPFSGLIIMFVVGFVSAVLAGAALGFLMVEVPYVKLRFLGPFLCGGLGGGGLMYATKWGKIRSGSTKIWVGLLLSMVLMYVSWVVYINLLLKEQLPAGVYIYMPTDVWAMIKAFNETGIWDFGGGATKGTTLTIFWLLEIGIVVCSFVGIGMLHDPPFCEACNVWAKKTLEKPVYQFDPEDQLEVRFAEEGAAVLDQLKVADPQSAHLVEVVVHQCPSCSDSNFLTLNHTPMKLDEKGKIEKDSTNVLVAATPVSQEDVEKVQKMSQLREVMIAEGGTAETPNEEADKLEPNSDSEEQA